MKASRKGKVCRYFVQAEKEREDDRADVQCVSSLEGDVSRAEQASD
jgi:hypothetical protein